MTDDATLAFANRCVATVIVFYLAAGFLMFVGLAVQGWLLLREKDDD